MVRVFCVATCQQLTSTLTVGPIAGGDGSRSNTSKTDVIMEGGSLKMDPRETTRKLKNFCIMRLRKELRRIFASNVGRSEARTIGVKLGRCT